MRGCACRGDSAGLVHLECLTELAKNKEASGDLQAWIKCGNCKQSFEGALGLEISRRFWRHHRSSQDLGLRYNSSRSLAARLANSDELDGASQLLDEASTCVGSNTEALLDLKLIRASVLFEHDQNLEALGLLQATLPEAKAYAAHPHIYCRTMDQMARVLLVLDRYQEAHEAAVEAVAFTKAKFGLEDPLTLIAWTLYAAACAKLGRVEEAKANFNYVLTTQTRVLGRDHPDTQMTRAVMSDFGFPVPSG